MNDLERIELDAAADFWAAAPPDVRATLALDVHELAGARCFRCRVLQPTLMFRRAVLVAPADDVDLEVLERHMGALEDSWAVGCAPCEGREALARKLAARGFGAAYSWMKFRRHCRPLAAPDTELAVRVLGAADGAAFASVVAQTYALEGAAVAWLATLPGRARWASVAAFDGAHAVGAAAAYVDGDHAWLGFAATLPEERRRGALGALLVRRIDEAAARGARVAVTETGERVAGKPSHSYRNILRAGFEEDPPDRPALTRPGPDGRRHLFGGPLTVARRGLSRTCLQTHVAIDRRGYLETQSLAGGCGSTPRHLKIF